MSRSLLLAPFLTTLVAAQGGQFRGSGSVVPPGPGAPAAPAAAGRGVALGEDLTRWSYLWEFHKDRFVLAGRAANRAADRGPIRAAVRPVLARLEREAVQPDVVVACLLAMARLAEQDDGEVLERLRHRLHDAHPYVRSMAAVALGLAPFAEAEDDLLALIHDSSRGRRLVDKGEVGSRTRAFACYGLALRGWRTGDLGTRTRAFSAFDAVLQDSELEVAEVETAALLGLGRLGPFAGKEEIALRRVILETLEREYRADRPIHEQRIQSHAALSLARVVGRDGPPELRARYREWFVAELEERLGDGRRNDSLKRGAAMALGLLARPDGEEVTSALARYFEDGRDRQTRYLCLWAMARIGGERNRAFVLSVLATGHTAIERPWAALSLAMAAEPPAVDETAKALLAQMRQTRAPSNLAAYGIALALVEEDRAAPRLREVLATHGGSDEVAGYTAVALALLGDAKGMEMVRELADESRRRPDLQQRLALALGIAGNRRDVPRLLEMIEEADGRRVLMGSAAHALGRVGDAATLEPLIRMASDHKHTLVRAFAVVALGYLASDDPLPWCAPIAEDLHYRATVPTLVGDGPGLLEHY